MKVLIVCKGFYPQLSPRAFRATELAKEFADAGHDVTVLLPKTVEDRSPLLANHRLNVVQYGPLKWETLGPSAISWIGDWKRKFGRLLFFLIDHPNIQLLWELRPFLKRAEGYDLVISIAVPHSIHWAIALVRTAKHPIGKTWVADCGDPYMGNVLESVRPMFYFAWLEKLFCRKADYITIPTETAIGGYYKEFHPKIKVIPQGFNFDGIHLAPPPTGEGIPNLAYAGGVSTIGIRSLNKVIDALLSTHKPFKLHVFSQNGKTVLQGYAKKHPANIILHDAIERNQLIHELSKMDFLVNLDNGTALNTPSKLIDYSLANRPILNINPLEPEINLLRAFLDRDYAQQLKLGNLQAYNIKQTIQKFTALSLHHAG